MPGRAAAADWRVNRESTPKVTSRALVRLELQATGAAPEDRRILVRYVSTFALLLACGWASVSQADPYGDFRIPAHRTWLGRLGAWGSGSWAGATLGARESNLVSHLLATTQSAWDSENRTYSFAVEAGVLNQHARHRLEQESLLDRLANDRFDTRGSAFGGLREYPWTMPVGLSISVATFGTRGWRHQDQDRIDPVTNTHFHLADRVSTRSVALSTGAGWGRVRDATPVFQVHVLEDRLRSSGVLSQPLSKPAREKLAQLFYVRGDFSRAHDRPERFFWREVEKIAREDGALTASGLDAESILFALESIQPSVNGSVDQSVQILRQRGTFAGLFLEARHSRQKETFESTTLTGSTQSSNSRTSIFSNDMARAGGEVDFHRPVGWRWQFDASSRFLVPVRPDEHGFELFSSASAQWLIADRWRSDITVAHGRAIFEPRGADVQDSSWNVNWGADVAYFLEDRTQVRVQFVQNQARSGTEWHTETQIRAGLDYRFLGRLDAPSLIAPVRRLATR